MASVLRYCVTSELLYHLIEQEDASEDPNAEPLRYSTSADYYPNESITQSDFRKAYFLSFLSRTKQWTPRHFSNPLSIHLETFFNTFVPYYRAKHLDLVVLPWSPFPNDGEKPRGASCEKCKARRYFVPLSPWWRLESQCCPPNDGAARKHSGFIGAIERTPANLEKLNDYIDGCVYNPGTSNGCTSCMNVADYSILIPYALRINRGKRQAKEDEIPYAHADISGRKSAPPTPTKDEDDEILLLPLAVDVDMVTDPKYANIISRVPRMIIGNDEKLSSLQKMCFDLGSELLRLQWNKTFSTKPPPPQSSRSFDEVARQLDLTLSSESVDSDSTQASSADVDPVLSLYDLIAMGLRTNAPPLEMLLQLDVHFVLGWELNLSRAPNLISLFICLDPANSSFDVNRTNEIYFGAIYGAKHLKALKHLKIDALPCHFVDCFRECPNLEYIVLESCFYVDGTSSQLIPPTPPSGSLDRRQCAFFRQLKKLEMFNTLGRYSPDSNTLRAELDKTYIDLSSVVNGWVSAWYGHGLPKNIETLTMSQGKPTLSKPWAIVALFQEPRENPLHINICNGKQLLRDPVDYNLNKDTRFFCKHGIKTLTILDGLCLRDTLTSSLSAERHQFPLYPPAWVPEVSYCSHSMLASKDMEAVTNIMFIESDLFRVCDLRRVGRAEIDAERTRLKDVTFVNLTCLFKCHFNEPVALAPSPGCLPHSASLEEGGSSPPVPAPVLPPSDPLHADGWENSKRHTPRHHPVMRLTAGLRSLALVGFGVEASSLKSLMKTCGRMTVMYCMIMNSEWSGDEDAMEEAEASDVDAVINYNIHLPGGIVEDGDCPLWEAFHSGRFELDKDELHSVIARHYKGKESKTYEFGHFIDGRWPVVFKENPP